MSGTPFTATGDGSPHPSRPRTPGAAGFTGSPTGFRRLTPGLLAADRVADGFDGLPDEVEFHGQLLAAFKAASSRLGLSPRLVHAVDWLFQFTRPQDWEETRPIVWPSARLQQEALGLSVTQVKALNRALVEAGVIAMEDSPNGKRYGVRDRTGRIVEAYGFDLSPLAVRYKEFVCLAAEAKAERLEMGRLRRRGTIARKEIIQILEAVAEHGFGGEEWLVLNREARGLVVSLRRVDRPEEMAFIVEGLERKQNTARKRLEFLLFQAESNLSESVKTDPKGSEYRPHIIPTNPAIYPEQDTVIAHKGYKSASGPDLDMVPPDLPPLADRLGGNDPSAEQTAQASSATQTDFTEKPEPVSSQYGQQRFSAPPRTDDDMVLKLSIDELTRIAPRLRPYMTSPRPAWPEVVNAADWLRGELGVSKSLWGDACVAMGREQAAIAVAIVSAKPADHFRTTPGGYFNGMVEKAKAGQLDLSRTIWGLRQAGKRNAQDCRRDARTTLI